MKTYQKYEGKEGDFQKAVATYLDHLNVLWCHVPNGSYKSKAAAGIFKAQGLKAGVPDIIIFEPRGDSIGLAIELKVGSNKPSIFQLEWLDKLHSRGWKVCVSHSFDEVKDLIDNYLDAKAH